MVLPLEEIIAIKVYSFVTKEGIKYLCKETWSLLDQVEKLELWLMKNQ